MVEKSGSSRSERKKLTTDYLYEPGKPIVFAWIGVGARLKKVKKFGKNRRKRSKVDKWRFKQ
ncbi:MAG: hypothetical protein RTV41_04155 [Candidatus Thorarchaeota archaeon]